MGREKKMLINEEPSRNVYENNQTEDNFTELKGDISTQRNDILYRSTHILLKSSVFLSRLERWGTNLSLSNVETRDRREIAPSYADALLMRRTQDANMREVRRLINLLLRIKRYERQMEALEKTAALQDI
jgi:hypothetical protein